MKKFVSLILISFFLVFTAFAKGKDDYQKSIDSLEKSFKYQTGVIDLEPGAAKLTVPEGFRFLNKEQAEYILTTLWGNPADASTLGLLVPINHGVLDSNTWVFVISYDDMGFVKDDDASSINYNEMMADMKKESVEANKERVKQGYDAIEIIGWASTPFYDKNKKILHWAKEIKFSEGDEHTLNYNLRVLGRKGVFMLNAVASMSALPEVKANIDKVIGSVEFKDGSKYSDFKPSVDKVAAWTIGGLVAGKILAKVGFFAVILKFWKLGVLALAGAGAAIKRFFTGKRKNDDQQQPPINADNMGDLSV